jgi:DNA-binding response OmpR family regulator
MAPLPDPHAPKKRVLIVDDEPYIVLVLRSRLEHHGYETVEAFTGKEALEQARDTSPDLVLLDFFLPDIMGNKVLGAFRKDTALFKKPIIMMSAFHSREADLWKREGATDVLFKPIDTEELIGKIEKYLRD